MTPDQISKLPPELRKAAELCEKGNDVTSNEFWERFDALPLALTWGLQVMEERDAANKRAKFLNGYSERRFDDAKKFYDELEVAKATIATLTRERDEAREELKRIKTAQENLRIMRHN